MLDVLLSLEKLEAGDYDRKKLIKKFEGILTDEHERNKILQLAGDSAVLVIERLDKVSVGEPHS